MRLVNAKSYEIESFLGDSTPPYAILSHTWGEDEVSYQDMVNHTAASKSGFNKVKLCCETALQQHYQYVWIDTCCIDKTSSAELSEAINSMFQWYRQSNVCYAYLADVELFPDQEEEFRRQLRRSRWFTRGWTLQELLAPSEVGFFDKSMSFIGTRSLLATAISKITGIHRSALHGSYRNLDYYSVAQRMSWAANRTTTRPEDRAYSLLGLFNVNMTLLYGEGINAFDRLLRKIIESNNDRSIFACVSESIDGGLLALSPDQFSGCSNVHADYDSPVNSEYTKVQGQIIEATFMVSPKLDILGTRLAYLGCYQTGTNSHVCRPLIEGLQGGLTTFWSVVPNTHFISVSEQKLNTFVPTLVRIAEPARSFQRTGLGIGWTPISSHPPMIHFKVKSMHPLDASLVYKSDTCHPSAMLGDVYDIPTEQGQDSLGVSKSVLRNARFTIIPNGLFQGRGPYQIFVLVLKSTPMQNRILREIAIAFGGRNSGSNCLPTLYVDKDQDGIRQLECNTSLGWESYKSKREKVLGHTNQTSWEVAGCRICLRDVSKSPPKTPKYEVNVDFDA